MKYLTCFLLFIFANPLTAQQSPCSNEKFRAFDFWIGNWRVETQDGKLAGHNRVEVILDSCIILENWTGNGVSRGKSFNHFDWETGKWKQKWVDNFASNLEFIGEVANDTARYECTSKNFQTGEMVYNKMMIAKVTDDEVHQVWQQSKDNKEWTVVFDGKYIRIKDPHFPTIEKSVLEVYATFSKAYETLDHTLVADLYATDAMYLFGKDAIMVGQENISKNFEDFFTYLKSNNTSAKLEFKFLDRQITPTMVADIGYYLLTYTNKDGLKNEASGKFATVLQLQPNGKWQFISDSYTDAPVEAFKKLD